MMASLAGDVPVHWIVHQVRVIFLADPARGACVRFVDFCQTCQGCVSVVIQEMSFTRWFNVIIRCLFIQHIDCYRFIFVR